MIRLRHLAAASAVALSLTVAASPLSTPVVIAPALAQSIVFDPNNYAQNVLTAARELQQINNQITALPDSIGVSVSYPLPGTPSESVVLSLRPKE